MDIQVFDYSTGILRMFLPLRSAILTRRATLNHDQSPSLTLFTEAQIAVRSWGHSQGCCVAARSTLFPLMLSSGSRLVAHLVLFNSLLHQGVLIVFEAGFNRFVLEIKD